MPCVLRVFVFHSKNFGGVKLNFEGFVKNGRGNRFGKLIILGQFPRRFLINSSSFSQNSCCDISRWITESIAMSRCLVIGLITKYCTRSVASLIIGGGGLIFIYACSAQLISFEIDCFYGV